MTRLRHFKTHNGTFYLLVGESHPVLVRGSKEYVWKMAEPDDFFWERVHQQYHMSEIGLSEKLEDIYDEMVLLK